MHASFILQDYATACPNLRVLYLFENSIEDLDGLEACPLLTHLYLQNNKLSSMSGVFPLKNLTKL